MQDEKKPNPHQNENATVPRKPYVPPEVRPLGRMSDRTLGIGGSNFDPGHNNNTKRGAG
jgi:hypothetical protein